MASVDVDVEQHSYCFETLANPLRLDIIRILDEGPSNVTKLAEATGAERSRVSHALQILRQCSLVDTEKQGREIIYKLSNKTPLFKQKRGNIFTLIEEHARTNCPTCVKYRQHHAKKHSGGA